MGCRTPTARTVAKSLLWANDSHASAEKRGKDNAKRLLRYDRSSPAVPVD